MAFGIPTRTWQRLQPTGRRLVPVWHAALLLFLMLISIPGLAQAQANDAQPSEYEVKAAFLLNFTKFVEWPAEAFAAADAPLEICIEGEDPFGQALDEMVQGETAGGRRIDIRRLNRPPQARECQVLFLSAHDNNPAALGMAGVLTVGESDDFLRQGGIIRFVLENRRVRFDINLQAANKAGLKLSSKLLSVARSVMK
jgi:hypothetical protein